MNFGRAEIGVIVLSSWYVLVAAYMIGGLFGVKITYSLWISIVDMAVAFALGVHITGLILYISDRKNFLYRRRRDRTMSTLLAILGLILIAGNLVSALFVYYLWGFDKMHSLSPLTWEESRFYVLNLTLNGIGFFSGILLLSDRGNMLQSTVSYRLSRQELTVEPLTKYPENLFTKYLRRYPHNPEGVLEWHIHEKMKEGKTREQAIEELENIARDR